MRGHQARGAHVAASGEGGGLGGGVDGFIGYHWDPVGVELFVGAQYDQTSPTLKWGPSSTDPGFGPDPARTEDFSVRRVGGFGIVRVRLTLQGEKLRFSVAGGVGLSYRSLLLTRDTTRDADRARDAFVPDAQSYLSPIALARAEPPVPARSAHRDRARPLDARREPARVRSDPDDEGRGGHGFSNGPAAPPSGLTTPAYELASGTQVFIGPFIGMMFGP